ncbi:hypothetical protein [Pseudomonas serbica]|uniref:hypothetical protein n=1 Tax=Pseudomonas serbica TaxID=2965074 RepID=UPI00237C25FB|nr:hypothetical protein [Pseudomonas serbica]
MKIKNDQVDEMYGRMSEACDIERAIESGQITSLSGVLEYVQARSLTISEALSSQGFIGGRHTKSLQQDLIQAQREAGEPDVVLH